MPEDGCASGTGQASEQEPARIVRPPEDDAERGKDEVDHGWGDAAATDARRRDAAKQEFLRRHAADRPPHHDSDWG